MEYTEIVLKRLRYQFCPMCQAELVQKTMEEDQIQRPCCPACDWIHYPSNAVGVNVLITTDTGIVAVLPPNAPKGYPAALPGGHADYGEAPEAAAVREAFEETGLIIEITRCLGWEFKRNMVYPGPMISFYYEAIAVGGEMRASSEGQVKAYPLEEFPPIAPARGGSRKTFELYKEAMAQRKPGAGSGNKELVLHVVAEEELSVLNHLFEFAIYDLSELNQANVKPSGFFEPSLNVQDLYRDPNYFLYLIKVEEKLAGFVIVKHLAEEAVYYLNHFFVMRKYRRQGVGRQAAEEIFDRFQGKWRVSEFDWNVPAQRFWRDVLERYTKGRFTEGRRADQKGPLQEFVNGNL